LKLEIDGGFRIKKDDQIFIFRTLKDVILYYNDTLTNPIKERTNDLAVDSAKIISNWKHERDRQMEPVEKLVGDLFDVNLDVCHLLAGSTNNNNNPMESEKVSAIINRLFTPLM
jgi:hypothetical protein